MEDLVELHSGIATALTANKENILSDTSIKPNADNNQSLSRPSSILNLDNLSLKHNQNHSLKNNSPINSLKELSQRQNPILLHIQFSLQKDYLLYHKTKYIENENYKTSLSSY